MDNQYWRIREELKSLVVYCENVIRPNLATLGFEYIETKRRLFNRKLIHILLFLITVSVLPMFIDGGLKNIFKCLLVIWAAIILFSSSNKHHDIVIDAKARILPDMLSHLGWGYTARLAESSDFKHLNEYGIFPIWERVSHQDKIKGEISNIPFTAHEINLEWGTGDNKINNGFFLIKAPTLQKTSGVTFIRAKNLSSNLLGRVKKLKRIKFVSSDFEKSLDVFSNDAVEAHFLLPPDELENITAFCQDMKRNLQSIVFMDDNLYIILRANDFFEIKRMQVELAEPIHVDSILDEIELIFKVFDYLKPLMKKKN